MIGVWRRIGLPMSLFSVKLSLNSFWPIFGVPSAATNGRPMPPKLKPPPPPPPNPPPPPPALNAPIIVDSSRAIGRGSMIVV